MAKQKVTWKKTEEENESALEALAKKKRVKQSFASKNAGKKLISLG
jgi:hypothetical protein